jgi:hypothetical protein
MALKHAPRVEETTQTIGTGTIILLGPKQGRQSILAGIGNGGSMLYCVEDGNKSDWEVGIGTVAIDSPFNTFTRDTILFSSSSGAKIALSEAIPHTIYCCPVPGFSTGDYNHLDTIHSRMMEKDSGLVVKTHPIVTSGTTTLTFDYEDASVHKASASGGDITFAFANWPPSGNEGIMQLDLTNFGLTASYVFPSNIKWTLYDDSEVTDFSEYADDRGGSIRLPSAGTATIVLRTTDAGATINGIWL